MVGIFDSLRECRPHIVYATLAVLRYCGVVRTASTLNRYVQTVTDVEDARVTIEYLDTRLDQCPQGHMLRMLDCDEREWKNRSAVDMFRLEVGSKVGGKRKGRFL